MEEMKRGKTQEKMVLLVEQGAAPRCLRVFRGPLAAGRRAGSRDADCGGDRIYNERLFIEIKLNTSLYLYLIPPFK